MTIIPEHAVAALAEARAKRQAEDLIAAAADGQADDASALPTRAKAQDAQAKAKAQAFA